MKLIQSRDNAFFKSLKRLAESGRERRKTGQTLLDGVHLVEAYEAAYPSVGRAGQGVGQGHDRAPRGAVWLGW